MIDSLHELPGVVQAVTLTRQEWNFSRGECLENFARLEYAGIACCTRLQGRTKSI